MSARLDGCPWLPEDAERSKFVGATLPIKCAAMEYRGDLPERASKAGLKTHAAEMGCMRCLAPSSLWHSRHDERTLHNLPFPVRTHDGYVNEVRNRCTFIRISTEYNKRALSRALAWRQEYPSGLCVVGKKGTRWGLFPGYRLVLGGDIWRSPWELEDLIVPFTIVFLRVVKGTAISGMSIMSCFGEGFHNHWIEFFTIDMFVDCRLHTVDLGVSSRFVGTAVLCALRLNVFGLEDTVLKSRLVKGVWRVKKSLPAYYNRTDASVMGDKNCTRIKTLTLKKFGNLRTPCLKAKGAETKDLVAFSVELLLRLGDRATVRSHRLLQAGRHLLQWYALCKEHARFMPINAKVELFNAAVNHVVLYKKAGGHLVYKHHALLHLTQLVCSHGNPSYFHTYQDEHENGLMARVGEIVHASTFAISCFERIHLQQRLGAS